MMTFSERVKVLVDTVADRNQTLFAREIGLTSQRINQIIKNGKGELGMEPFYKVIIKFKVNPEWLLYGKGPMFFSKDLGTQPKDNVHRISDFKSVLHPETEMVVEMMQEMSPPGRAVVVDKARDMLKVYGWKVLGNSPQ